ncbi:hypothetical protein K458DRAFT_178900 [Lentithecium fluviatile CBS 122367]|uniref:Uncharacterized protein n=1 Tax=Lentithecium fluviatile CBS 122367 TaxID=1168545 RepID=A0A6G1IFN3_9PLEO|nr:hypothetical protein K458DRAFT_178900 [Lentithecium fluviatile CBS 122367]
MNTITIQQRKTYSERPLSSVRPDPLSLHRYPSCRSARSPQTLANMPRYAETRSRTWGNKRASGRLRGPHWDKHTVDKLGARRERRGAGARRVHDDRPVESVGVGEMEVRRSPNCRTRLREGRVWDRLGWARLQRAGRRTRLVMPVGGRCWTVKRPELD